MHTQSGGAAGTRHPVWALIGWLVLCYSASATAVFVSTDGWYAALAKPAWNPPAWIFGPVWTVLYAMMAVAAWMVWCRGGWRVQTYPLMLFVAQWALNALWTPLFFGLKQPGLAFGAIVLLWGALIATLHAFRRVRPAAALLLLPYAAWLTFAVLLNYTIWRMNL